MGAGAVQVNINSPRAKKCTWYDGTDDSISLTANLARFLALSEGTICGWLQHNHSGIGMIIGVELANTDCLRLYVNSGVLFVYLKDNNVNILNSQTSSALITSRVWKHFAYTSSLTAGNLLYVDGAIAGRTDTTGSAATNDTFFKKTTVAGANPTSMTIGKGIGASNYEFTGGIADLQVHNRVLTLAEITAVMNGHVNRDTLVSKWDFANDDYNDSFGINHGTNDGTRIAIVDDTLAAAIKADRKTAKDRYIMCETSGPEKQVISAIVEEAP